MAGRRRPHELNGSAEGEVSVLIDEEDEEGEWEEWEGDDASDNEVAARSLFDVTVLPSVAAICEHDAEHHGFDLRQYRLMERLDEYDTIRVINYIRSRVAEGVPPRDVIEALQAESKPYADDKWLQPFLPDDALLFYAVDADPADHRPARTEAGTGPDASGAEEEVDELKRLRDENEALREALQSLCLDSIPAELLPDRSQNIQQGQHVASSSQAGPSSSGKEASRLSVGHPVGGGRSHLAVMQLTSVQERVDRNYFDSYGYFEIHREMLSDKVRTDAYQRALEGNPDLIRGRTVLDVGCGTAILSMFAARAGASSVVAVEGSWRMAEVARQVTAQNGVSVQQGGPIHVVQGRMEELAALPLHSFDVLVSEWMGYALLFEAMLDSVLYARDRWLKPGGAILPDLASLHLAGVGEGPTGLGFWRDVYGFSMQHIAQSVQATHMRSAAVLETTADDVVTDSVCIRRFDLATMQTQDSDFTADFQLRVNPKGETSNDKCQALALWFDVNFSERFCKEQPVTLSTAPTEPLTHWKQTLLTLREPIPLAGAEGGGGAVTLTGRISLARGATPRSLDVSLECIGITADGAHVGQGQPIIYCIEMSE